MSASKPTDKASSKPFDKPSPKTKSKPTDKPPSKTKGKKQRKPLRKPPSVELPSAIDASGERLPVGLEPGWDAALSGSKFARWRTFILHYLVDRNGLQSAIKAGFSPNGASVTAFRLLSDPKVKAVIQAHEAALAKHLGISIEEYARETMAMATADPQELMQMRRVCCRYCHSPDPTKPLMKPSEVTAARQEHEARRAELLAKSGKDVMPEFEEPVAWYNPKQDPNPECLECRGEGEVQPFFADTRALKGSARKLFRGLRVGKDGLEMKTADQDAHWANMGRIIGAFKDRDQEPDATDVASAAALGATFGAAMAKSRETAEQVRSRRAASGMDGD
ncbi:terminase small subunit [Ideonella livida]|uniref:Terminase small subunit n=1 Tax=Ideonella livida TaxID=2707176 RepID=A0A7C9PEP0_9BURK|nr:terminase small subunit [Ideonella livida]NDY89748.1 terminase small subunit [Ideonella livida]